MILHIFLALVNLVLEVNLGCFQNDPIKLKTFYTITGPISQTEVVLV